MRKIVFLLLFTSFFKVSAQELECIVDLNTDMLSTSQNSDPAVFRELEQAVTQFMNSQRWTNDIYGDEEKIQCKLTINLMKSPAQNVFNGNTQFQVLRPVYGTDYETVIFQFVDNNFNISFAPVERQMVFNEQGYTNNLTSILAFYSLMALIVDYDSFEKMGGDPFIQRALNVANLAPSGDAGWSQKSGSRNRYRLVENYQNQQLRRFREGFYEYHRLSLDQFGKDPDKARASILKYLEVVQNIVILRSNWMAINGFFDAKVQEMIKIFSKGSPEEKQQAFLLLSNLDPDKTEQYRKIVL